MPKCINFICLLLFSFSLSAAPQLGTVTDTEGKVTIHNEHSPRGKRVRSTPEPVHQNQFVRTYANSKARIKLADDSKILVTESATLEFSDEQNLFVKDGRVLFSINKRDAIKSLNILTKTAVIGVKGTVFLVEANGDEAMLHLREGEVEVKSLAEGFEDFKAEYEKFKRDYLKEFSEFKQTLSIKSGTTISIGKKGLKEVETPSKIDKLFEELDQF